MGLTVASSKASGGVVWFSTSFEENHAVLRYFMFSRKRCVKYISGNLKTKSLLSC